jgi:hypothetical protein
MVIPEGKHPLPETDLSSNNDNRWPEGSPSEKALRRLIVRSEVRDERKPEPSLRYRKRSKTDRETRAVEPKNNMSSIDRIGDERNMDTIKALKQQVLELKKKLKKNKNFRRSEHSSRPKTRSKPAQSISSDNSSTSVEDTKEEESSDGRNKGGKSSGRGSRGNWSESPSMTRPPYKARRGQETMWKALHQISHFPFSKEIEIAHLSGKFSSLNYVMYNDRADPIGHISSFMAEAFVSRFITNSKKPKEFDSLLSMRMKNSESLKSYSSRYWQVYNEVDGCTKEIAIKTFKVGLDPESELRHNL